MGLSPPLVLLLLQLLCKESDFDPDRAVFLRAPLLSLPSLLSLLPPEEPPRPLETEPEADVPEADVVWPLVLSSLLELDSLLESVGSEERFLVLPEIRPRRASLCASVEPPHPPFSNSSEPAAECSSSPSPLSSTSS
jgi:hypothetical protein